MGLMISRLCTFRAKSILLSVCGPQVDTCLFTTAGWNAQPYSINFDTYNVSLFEKSHMLDSMSSKLHFGAFLEPCYFLLLLLLIHRKLRRVEQTFQEKDDQIPDPTCAKKIN